MRLILAIAAAGWAGMLAQPSQGNRISEETIRELRAGPDGAAWLLLRSSPDNTTRSYLVRDLSRVGVSFEVVSRRLHAEADVSARRALVLALGSYNRDALAPTHRQSIDALLRQWYESDPDPGVHSAVQWLRREWGSQLPQPAKSMALASDRRWYVTAEGQTMAVFTGPSSVQMGSPPDEPGRQPASDSAAEPLHTIAIPRSFAMATTEVTVAEFRRFLEANPEVKRDYSYPGAPARMAEVLARFSPDDAGPAIAVTWYEAAMYCNWLSAREGLPQSDWVYPTGVLTSGMRMPSNYLQRTGYRLPTEAEWEFAARAGTSTARFFGSTDELLPDYAWFARNPPRARADVADPTDPQRTSPVGALKPNDFGLFDVYGNVWEWTQDRVERHQTGALHDDGEDQRLLVLDRDARTRRGGAFPYGSAMARSGARGTVTSLPTNRRDNVGFRVARTIP